MSSPIRSLRQSQPAASQRASQAASSKSSSVSAQPAKASRASQPPAATSAAPLGAAAKASTLTEPEQQMIARQFPDAPELSMRLYGPGRGAETIRPGAVGSRLDVQG